MKRREFIKYGAYGVTVVAFGSMVTIPRYLKGGAARLPNGGVLRLSMKEVLFEMVDKRPVYHWAFVDAMHGPRIPGVMLMAREGETINVELTNEMDEAHAFAIPGVVDSGPLAAGESRTLSFVAPRGGTYLYFDPLNAPVNRVMGLYGAMVVLPAVGNTPYSDPTPLVQGLFDALGDQGTMPEFFPGDAWDPARSWVWLFAAVDHKKNEMVRNLPAGQNIDPEVFLDGYLPQYFLLTGKSGFFSSHDPEIFPHGNIGQPAIIRTLNAGLATHSPHIHGTHLAQIAVDGVVAENPFSLDTWSLPPLGRVDLFHPFIVPIDAHPWPPSNILEFPMPFTMHCHTEMSQTAAGGNYPQGAVTDWEIRSPQVGGPEASEEEFPSFRGMDPALFKRTRSAGIGSSGHVAKESGHGSH